MATSREVLGFGSVLIVTSDDDALEVSSSVSTFLEDINKVANSCNISTNAPSDAFDAARDSIIDEAARRQELEWEIVGDTLRLWPLGLTVRWETMEEVS